MADAPTRGYYSRPSSSSSLSPSDSPGERREPAGERNRRATEVWGGSHWAPAVSFRLPRCALNFLSARRDCPASRARIQPRDVPGAICRRPLNAGALLIDDTNYGALPSTPPRWLLQRRRNYMKWNDITRPVRWIASLSRAFLSPVLSPSRRSSRFILANKKKNRNTWSSRINSCAPLSPSNPVENDASEAIKCDAFKIVPLADAAIPHRVSSYFFFHSDANAD